MFTVEQGTNTARLIGYQILLGFGQGSAIQNTVSPAIHHCSGHSQLLLILTLYTAQIVVAQSKYMHVPERVAQATGLVTFMQLLGASIGLA